MIVHVGGNLPWLTSLPIGVVVRKSLALRKTDRVTLGGIAGEADGAPSFLRLWVGVVQGREVDTARFTTLQSDIHEAIELALDAPVAAWRFSFEVASFHTRQELQDAALSRRISAIDQLK